MRQPRVIDFDRSRIIFITTDSSQHTQHFAYLNQYHLIASNNHATTNPIAA